MELFTNLGIDLKLLLLQIVNFGILVLILKKFIYKPLVKRIEDDERKLRQADVSMQKLDKERLHFEKYKEEQEQEIQEKARNIITDAEAVAQEIIEEAHRKARRDEDRIVSEAAHLRTLQKKEEVFALEDEVRERLRKKVRKWMKSLTEDTSIYESMWSMYLGRFFSSLEELTFSSGVDTLVITIESSSQVSAAVKERIKKSLPASLVDISYKESEELIVGLRFEGGGYRVDANLATDIEKIWKRHEE